MASQAEPHPRRRDRVFAALTQRTRALTADSFGPGERPGFEAGEIGGMLGVAANNAGVELNALTRDGLALKVAGRPVYFLARAALEERLGVRLARCVFKNHAALRAALSGPASAAPEGDGLSELIGADQSLKHHTDQARAALLYPPDGLHTLITGETGVGKSRFARAMHQYAVSQGVIAPGAAFAVYNCANYSENPQLLLSQLFGYKKGAFTGADRDTKGIVDLADGGVLFLDEAHRLSPEGQEKMFLLIDQGVFQRLGETGGYHRARLRIIAATTEDPGSILLHTFLRRIPVLIKIPSLEQRGVDERIRFIFSFLSGESRQIGLELLVHREVIRALTLYRCPGNIGQLRSDIQLLCAGAYLGRALAPPAASAPPLCLELCHLPERVEEGLFRTGAFSDAVFTRYRFYQSDYVPVGRLSPEELIRRAEPETF